MKNHILYISYDGLTDQLGQSQIIPYLTSLADTGYSISIISAEKKPVFKNKRKYILQILKDHKIDWHPVFYTKRPYVISTLWDIIKIRRKAKSLNRQKKFEIVHCRSYIPALTGLYLKKKYSMKFIFDMRGFYADERIEGNIWNIKNPAHKMIYKYFKKKEIDFLKYADYTVCLTNNAKEIIHNRSQFISNKPPIEVIPCCADLKLFSPPVPGSARVNDFKTILEIKDADFILSYSGSTGTWYMLEEMFRFFKCLSEKKDNAKFLLITKDDKKSIVDLAIKSGISEDRIIVRGAERNDMPFLLSLSHLSVFFIKPVFSKKASSPTKMAEVMGMGIPFISNKDVGDINEIVNNFGTGVLIDNFSEDEYNKVIDNIDNLLAMDKKIIIDAAHKLFSLQKGVDLYNSIYKKLLK